MRDGQRMQDDLCVDGYCRGTCKRDDATHDDPWTEDLVLGIEPRREEQTEQERQLQKRHDEHDGSDRHGRIEEPLCYGDEDAREYEPADALPLEQPEVAPQHSRGEKHDG